MTIGAGKIDQVFVANQKAITLSDTTMPCLAVNYSLRGVAAEVPTSLKNYATVTIAPTGATGSKVLITVTIGIKDQNGTAGTSITYALSGSATNATSWAGTSPTFTATAATLKVAIDLLNLIPNFKAYALDAPHDMSINSGSFIALAATYIHNQPGKFNEVLYRDANVYQVNSKYAAYMRIGTPTVRDKGSFQLINIYGAITGATNDQIRVYRDDYDEYIAPTGTYATDMAKKDVLLYVADPDYSAGIPANDILNGQTIRGPVIVEITSDDISAATVYVKIRQMTI